MNRSTSRNILTRTLKSIALFALLALAAPACTKKDSATTGAPAADEILIGEVGSLTGGEATFGTSTHNGIELAMKQVNGAGGVKGKKLRLLTLDDQGKPEEAATTVTKLITQDKVTAILGEVASSRSLAMAPIAQSYKVPMITPSSTNPRVTAVGNYIFRVCFIDPFQGAVMAKFAANTLKVTKVAILRDVKNDYSVGLANFFTETFKKAGGEIVADQSYSAGDVDFKSQLTSIKGKSPQAIFVPGYYTEVGLVARQARELGVKVPLMGGDGWDSEKLTEIGGDALNGSFFSNHYSPDDMSPQVQKFIADYKSVYSTVPDGLWAQVQKFIADYKSVYSTVPDGLAAMGYDAAMVLVDAMKRANSFSGEDIRQAIADTKNYQGVTGVITINENRDAVKSAVVIEVKTKKFVFKEKINPS